MIAVVDFRDRRPAWTLPDAVAERLTREAPPGWTFRFVDALADGSGDGGAPATPEALAAVRDADVYLGAGIPLAVLGAGAGLRWIHSGSGGVSAAVLDAIAGRDLVFTNSAGTHAPPVAETAIAMMLHFARGFDHAVRAQARGRWDRGAWDAADGPVREFAGSTVGVIGFGGIGAAIGSRAAALGARVLGLVRTPRSGPSDPPGARLLSGDDGLEVLLAESDYVALAAPETARTRGLLDERALRRMKAGAVLVNVARGRLLDEDALVGALRDGPLRGAGLDVFTAEPLAEGHPLWALPNVLITPHVSAVTPRYWERELALIQENVRRFDAGEPLQNVVDRDAGY